MGSANCGEPLRANSGRFWALADDAASESSVEDDDPVTGFSRYLDCSPASEGCVMVEAEISALRRREEKKRRQRQAAITINSGAFLDSVQSVSADVDRQRRSSGRKQKICTPVLSPSTFLLDSFDATEWILVQRRRRMARMAGPMKSMQFRSPVHRRQRSSPLRDLSSSLMHQRDTRFFKSVVSELGRAVPCVSALTHLVPHKGSMGPEPMITNRSATRVTF
jgi:hypothetical protein